MRAAKLFIKILLGLFVLAIGAAVLLVSVARYVNRNDEAPSAAVAEFRALQQALPAVAEHENGYIFALGFAAPESDDAYQVGFARLAWLHRLEALPLAAGDEEKPQDPLQDTIDVEGQRPPALKELILACGSADRACAEQLAANEDLLRAWLSSEAWLFERYRTLLSYPAWRELPPQLLDGPLVLNWQILDAQKLLLAQTWLLAGEGRLPELRDLLESEAIFWRRVLLEADTVVSKMYAAIALQRQLHWVSLALSRLPAEQIENAIPDAWASMISAQERSLKRVMASEWQAIDALLWQMVSKPEEMFEIAGEEQSLESRLASRAALPLLQPQATSNLQAGMLMEILQALEVSLEELPAATERALAIQERWQADYPPFGRLYNVIGDILFSIAAPSLVDYAGLIADLEGVRRAVLLAAQLRGAGVTAEQLPGRLADSELRNPYTGAPFGWDAENRTIDFPGLREDRSAHRIVY